MLAAIIYLKISEHEVHEHATKNKYGTFDDVQLWCNLNIELFSLVHLSGGWCFPHLWPTPMEASRMVSKEQKHL